MAKIKLKSYLKELHGREGSYIHYNVKGKQYVRSYSVPANPRTIAQQKNRAVFAQAVKAWQGLSPEEKYIYNRKAARRQYTGYNLFISMTMKAVTLPQKAAGKKEMAVERHIQTPYITGFNSVPLPYLLWNGYGAHQYTSGITLTS